MTGAPAHNDACGERKEKQMEPYAIVVIGASAGGIEALPKLVSALPAALPAALFVVQHVYPFGTSTLLAILNKAGALPASEAHNSQLIQPSHIYVAPANYHLLLESPGFITLSSGARENLHRPAIDPLFRTAARTYGPRVIGVLLTGTLDDGVAGLMAVKLRGGRAIVQAPADAAYPELPQNALNDVEGIDCVVSLAEMPRCLVEGIHELVAPQQAELTS
jgi:two-component system chemotaxis response regulator CheB